jgi:hypothetical protein
MLKSFIGWIPFIILLGIFIVFRATSFANRYYPIFLILMTCFGLALVLVYKFVIKSGPLDPNDAVMKME